MEIIYSEGHHRGNEMQTKPASMYALALTVRSVAGYPTYFPLIL